MEVLNTETDFSLAQEMRGSFPALSERNRLASWTIMLEIEIMQGGS